MSLTLADVREQYYSSSGTVSTLVRSICLGGIAVGWAIRVGDKSPVEYSLSVGWAFLFFVTALTLDLSQYFFQAVAWGLYNNHKSKNGFSLKAKINPPGWFNDVAVGFWLIKTITALVGIVILASCLWTCLLHPQLAAKPTPSPIEISRPQHSVFPAQPAQAP